MCGIHVLAKNHIGSWLAQAVYYIHMVRRIPTCFQSQFLLRELSGRRLYNALNQYKSPRMDWIFRI